METTQKICDLHRCFLCRNIPPDGRESIGLHKQNLPFKKGEVLFREGELATGIYFVFSGIAKIHKQWDGNKQLIPRFAAKGDILGHRGMGSRQVYTVSATALEPLVVCFVELPFFRETLKANIDLCYSLMVLFAEELEGVEQRMRDLAHMPVKGRVAQALLRLEQQFGCNTAGAINIRLSWTDLGSFAAATYETVFRVIRPLIKENLIAVTGKQICIKNRLKLAELVTAVEPAG